MSSVRDPIAVEPRRHPVRQMHDSLRRSHKIVGVQDDEIGRLVIHVYDEAEQPAAVLGPFGAERHAHELAGVAAGAEMAIPEERRVGNVCVRKCRYQSSPLPYITTKKNPSNIKIRLY